MISPNFNMSDNDVEIIIDYLMKVNGISRKCAESLFFSMEYLRRKILHLIVNANNGED